MVLQLVVGQGDMDQVPEMEDLDPGQTWVKILVNSQLPVVQGILDNEFAHLVTTVDKLDTL